MKTRQTSVARQLTNNSILTSDRAEMMADNKRNPAITASLKLLPDSVLVAERSPRREPTIEDLLSDPSLCVWSKWQ